MLRHIIMCILYIILVYIAYSYLLSLLVYCSMLVQTSCVVRMLHYSCLDVLVQILDHT